MDFWDKRVCLKCSLKQVTINYQLFGVTVMLCKPQTSVACSNSGFPSAVAWLVRGADWCRMAWPVTTVSALSGLPYSGRQWSLFSGHSRAPGVGAEACKPVRPPEMRLGTNHKVNHRAAARIQSGKIDSTSSRESFEDTSQRRWIDVGVEN